MKYFIIALERVPNILPAYIIVTILFLASSLLFCCILLTGIQIAVKLPAKMTAISCHHPHDTQNKVLWKRGKPPAYPTDFDFLLFEGPGSANSKKSSTQGFNCWGNLPQRAICVWPWQWAGPHENG